MRGGLSLQKAPPSLPSVSVCQSSIGAILLPMATPGILGTRPDPLRTENEQKHGTSQLGQPMVRHDGRAKVTGRAGYTGDLRLPHMAYAVALQSAIRRGRITSLRVREARTAPGVLDVITHENAPRLHHVPKNAGVRPGQSLLVLQSARIRYFGQYIAVVVAETLEQAQHAASLIAVTYRTEPSTAQFADVIENATKPDAVLLINPTPVDSQRGDPDTALRSAQHRVDVTYNTPIENHNPMEPHSTVAVWEGNRLTLAESTQWVLGTRNMVAGQLGLPPERVRVVTPFVGGGFGAKGQPWPHPTLAAIAAKRLGRPVKLVLTREQMFSQTGHRPATQQRFQLGADAGGRLTAVVHDTVSTTSRFDPFVEASGEVTRTAYSCPNLRVTHRIAPMDTNTPCPMRGPGEASGSFALECAMDELAFALDVDPLALRLRNYAKTDEERNVPFSSKSLRQCYADAAQRFGWSRRPPTPRSMRDGSKLVGWGMASAIFPAKLSPASARVTLHPDGRITVASATHEIGTGTLTSLRQIAADVFQTHVSRIALEIGDTSLPAAPSSAGSQTTASVGSAILCAAREARRKLLRLAVSDPKSPLFNTDTEDIDLEGFNLRLRTDPSRCEPWGQLLQRQGSASQSLEATFEWKPEDRETRPWSGWSFGAHFCEVQVCALTGNIRVTRWVASFAAGKIVNALTAHSQLMGGIVWGIGQALTEQTIHDNHGIVNRNLAEYLVPVNRDVPALDITLLPEEDARVNALGAKGLGELGICGAAAAVANAIFHATGQRVRGLPVRLGSLS